MPSSGSSAAGPTPHPLPPGQRLVEGFPRFGTHLHRPPPDVPSGPAIEVIGAVADPFAVPIAELAELRRREVTADFHCVSGWSATDLHWEGVAFRTFYDTLVVPRLAAGAKVSHLRFTGLDHYRSVAEIADVFARDVLIADRLNGEPLTPDHGAPVRLVSPGQYGYVNTKHLCRVEVLEQAPAMKNPAAIRIGRLTLRTPLVKTHPRARVWHEERHPDLPAWLLRPLYRAMVGPIKMLSARGSRPAPVSSSEPVPP
jgi:DMSO/TMAO reductase YedYZ molybdopterin-dependent catalytic subunit